MGNKVYLIIVLRNCKRVCMYFRKSQKRKKLLKSSFLSTLY